jgi:hypothetical protein
MSKEKREAGFEEKDFFYKISLFCKFLKSLKKTFIICEIIKLNAIRVIIIVLMQKL